MPIAEPTHTEEPITRIGEKYRVLQMLGSGGMGTVFEVENEWTGRRVAIKLLRPELTGVPTVVRRFLQEAQAASKIRHENIVDVLDMGRDATTGSYFIVQELLEGEDLGAWMQAHRAMSPREIFELLIPVMGALAAAHDAGIVHRDIKPENIFLARSANGVLMPKLIDFGISKLCDQNDAVKMTHTGMALGTPEYMSPEQARGDETLDGRTDIWSLGVVLYEVIAGHLPFEAKNYNLVVSRVLNEDVPRIETFVPDLPSSIATVVHRALERDLEKRYPTMRALVLDVLACPDLGFGSAASMSSRFGTAVHDSERPTDAPDPPALEWNEPECDVSPSTVPVASSQAPRPGWISFGLAAALIAVVTTTHWFPTRGVSNGLPSPAASTHTQLSASAPSRTSTSPSTSVETSPPMIDRTAHAADLPDRPSRSIRFVGRGTLARSEEHAVRREGPSPVTSARVSGPTSVVLRHHIVVE